VIRLFVIFVFLVGCGSEIDFDIQPSTIPQQIKEDGKVKKPKPEKLAPKPEPEEPTPEPEPEPEEPTPETEDIVLPDNIFNGGIRGAFLSDEDELIHKDTFDTNLAILHTHFVVNLSVGAYEMVIDYFVPDDFLYTRRIVKFIVGDYTGSIQGYPWEYQQAEKYGNEYLVSVGAIEMESYVVPQCVGVWLMFAELYNADGDCSVYFQVVE